MGCSMRESNHTRSVSYTHLDVYKRQVLPCATAGREGWGGDGVVTLAAVAARQAVARGRGLLVDDADGVVGGGHDDGVGRRRAAVVVRAVPAGHAPAAGRRRRQGDVLPGHILPRAAAGRKGGSGHRVVTLAGVCPVLSLIHI